MKIGIGLVIVLAALKSPTGRAENLAITDVTIISMEDEDGRQGTLLVEEGRIKAIKSATYKADPSRYQSISGKGKFVVPGLFDSHIHFFQSGSLYTRPDVIDLRTRVPYKSQEFPRNFKNIDITFRRYLASGITSVVDMGGPLENFKVREKAEKLAMAPRVYVAGPLLSTVDRKELDVEDKPIVKVSNQEEAIRWVNRLASHKPDFIKIWYIVPPGGSWKDNAELVQSIIRQSHLKGQRVAVHATELETARAAVQWGADVLVHSVDDRIVDQKFVNLLKEKSVFYIPTLAVDEGYRKTFSQLVSFSPLDDQTGDPFLMGSLFELPLIRYAAKPDQLKRFMMGRKPIEKPRTAMQNLKILADAGVAIVMGTDAGNIGTFHGSSVYRELEIMAEAGIKPLDILRMSSLAAAKMLKVDQDFGSIKAGKVADILVLDRDPREDIRNIQHLHSVIKGGRSYRRAELLAKTPAEVVQSKVNAYQSLDLETFLNHFARDAKYGPYQGQLQSGRDGIRETWGPLIAKSEWVRLSIGQRLVKGNYVLDVECGFRQIKSQDAEPEAIQAAILYKMESDLIQEMFLLPAKDQISYPKEIGQSGTLNLVKICQSLHKV